MQSICDALEIPHIECHWNIRDQVDHLSINLYPKPSSLSRAYVDLVKAWNWKSFAIVYEDNHGMGFQLINSFGAHLTSDNGSTSFLSIFNPNPNPVLILRI